jgi:hypothetical protein
MQRALTALLSLALAATVLAAPKPFQTTTSKPAAAAGGAPARITAGDLVGTWTLESAEHGVQTRASRIQNPRGLLIFDNAGHVFELQTSTGLPPPQPQGGTPVDALARFKAYAGFWGGYTIDLAKKTIHYKPEGAVSPAIMGRELERSFEIADNKLTITSAADEPHTEGGARWVWERVPQVDNLSAGYRQVIGFWQHVVEKRINLTTGAATETRRAPSIIVYSPSGYVGVHFPPMNRQPFAAAEPTDAEARAALMGFIGYYGALTVYPKMVFHQILAGLSPTAGATLKRPFELSGSEITIKFPVATNQQGQQTTTWVTLRRLSGAAEMLGR